jgi:hypothetical protein
MAEVTEKDHPEMTAGPDELNGQLSLREQRRIFILGIAAVADQIDLWAATCRADEMRSVFLWVIVGMICEPRRFHRSPFTRRVIGSLKRCDARLPGE